MTRLTKDQRIIALGRLQAGQKHNEVARHLNVFRSTISRLWARFQATASVADRPRSERPRATTPAQDRFIRLQQISVTYSRHSRRSGKPSHNKTFGVWLSLCPGDARQLLMPEAVIHPIDVTAPGTKYWNKSSEWNCSQNCNSMELGTFKFQTCTSACIWFSFAF